MIEETISKIEERLRTAGNMAPEKRQELLRLLTELKGEISDLSSTHAETAQNIAVHADRSTENATQERPDPHRIQDSVDQFSNSVSEFEESHPKLVGAVNRICVALSSLGI